MGGFWQALIDGNPNQWWESLGGVMKTFWFVGFCSTIVLLFQVFLMALGFDGHHDIDTDHDFSAGHDHDVDIDSGLRIVSFKTVVAFMAGFGWTGVLMQENGYGVIASTLGASLVGSLFGGVVILLLALFSKIKSSGNIDYKNVIGRVGTVYLPIAPSRTKAGVVQVGVQGVLRNLDAYTESSFTIPNGSKVKVVSLVDEKTALVETVN